MRPILSAAVAILLAGCMSPAPAPETTSVAWTQFGLGDNPDLIARVLLEGGTQCPSIIVDGVTRTMRERQDSRRATYGWMCEERLTLDKELHVRIAFGGSVILDQNVTRDPKTVAVLGDTGCRITSFFDQGCGDPAKWPFAQIAEQVARRSPSLIPHLGAHYYRETPCKGLSVDGVACP